ALHARQGIARRLAGLALSRPVAPQPAARAGHHRGLRHPARRGPRPRLAPAEGGHRRRPGRVRRHAARLPALAHAAARRAARHRAMRSRSQGGAGAASPVASRDVTTTIPRDLPVSIALPGLVIAIALIGDALIYAVLPLYHQEFGVS